MKNPRPWGPEEGTRNARRGARRHAKGKKKKKGGASGGNKTHPRPRTPPPATNNTEPVIAAHAMAVPRSGWKIIRPRKAAVGMMAGSNVSRQSSMDLVRHSRKNAKNRMRAGLAISEGWNVKLPQ